MASEFEERNLPGEMSWCVRVGSLAVSGNGLPPSEKCSPIGVHIVGPDGRALITQGGKVAGLGLTEEEWDELVARVALLRLNARAVAESRTIAAEVTVRTEHTLTFESSGRAVGWDGLADIYICSCGLRTEAAAGVVPSTCAAVKQ